MFLAGCSSAPKKKKAEVIPDCVFPGTNTAAPGWICDEPQPGIEVSAVGIAAKSQGGVSFMKDLAAADARGKLAAQFKVQVDRMIKSYLGNTGVGDTETIDQVSESILKTVTSETLYGSKIYKSRTGPQGRMFVLVGIDSENTQRAVERSVSTSMNNDQALWQQFKAQKGFDELKEEISKQNLR